MHRHRRPTTAVVIVSLLATLVLGVAPVLAAAQTQSTTLTFGGSADPSISYTVQGTCDDCIPDDLAQAFTGDPGSFAFGAAATTLVSHIDWTNAAGVDVNYDDALLRQGGTLGLSDVLTTGVGHVHASGSISGSYGLYNDASGGTDFTPYGGQHGISKSATWDFNCTIPLPGESPRSCTSGSQTFDIDSFTIFVVPFLDPISVKVDFQVAISLNLDVSSDGVLTVRQIEVLGGSGPSEANLTWLGSSPSTVGDSQKLSCTEPAGNPVAYRFTANGYAPTNSLAGTTALVAEVIGSPAVGPDFDITSLGTFASITSDPADVSFDMTAPTQEVTLGTLAKNNIPPTVDAGGPYSGVEGAPVSFDGSGSSSPCGFPTLRWDFSDGGVAFGKTPQHTFQGPGVYSGQLTATDATGLTSTTTFSVTIDNLAPATNAGPDTTTAWGRPVAFDGSAIDPGTDDQSTLTYAWSFGDGSPSATGGPSTIHSYATPGDYTATLTACDRWGACTPDSRVVHVVQRTVTVGYLGDTAGTYDTPGTLSASLVDQFGQVVSGRTISFSVNGAAAGSAVTNSSGIASSAYTPPLSAGPYPTGASFAGDSLYLANTGAGSISISRKATSVTYTGALNGGPNKTITLSAVLKDATGKALASRTITFVLGTQTVSAVTNGSGVASTSLKLSQKNGKYPLTATWTPSGVDAGDYTGSAASASFSLQAK
ncbi:MAG: PKD domain-containing protein [Candidatus Limnocylindrales bacterium]